MTHEASRQCDPAPQCGTGSGLSLKVKVKSLSRVGLLATPWTVAYQAFLSFTISRSLLRFMSIEMIKSSNHLIFGHPFLLKRRVLQCVFFNSVPSSGSCNLFYFFLPSRRSVSLKSESLRICVMKLATDSNILAWEIRFTEKSGGLQSIGS